MLYTLELGPVEQNIIQQALQTGQPIPDRIANAPTLQFGLNFILQAFFDLDSERGHGAGGPTRIPWHAVQNYAAFYGLDEKQSERLVYIIRRMDTAHLNRLYAELKE